MIHFIRLKQANDPKACPMPFYVSLCAFPVVLAGLELVNLSASVSQVLGRQVCATMAVFLFKCI
jgi:hypothetical protein